MMMRSDATVFDVDFSRAGRWCNDVVNNETL